jgi:hypothetical protein
MKVPFRSRKDPEPQGRRRPITTSSRPQAFSYYAQRSTADNPESTRRRLDTAQLAKGPRRGSVLARSLGNRFGLIIALLVVVISVFHIMSLSSGVKVAPLTDRSSGYFLHDTSEYQKTAEQLFDKSFLNRNKLTFNASAIETGMKAKYPELDDVAITLPLIGTRPIMYIQPTRPALVLNTANNGSYVIDANGTALIADSSQAALKSLPTINDLSGLKVSIGKRALSSSSVAFIQTITHQLNAQGVSISSLTLPTNSDELDVAIAGKPYFVKFNLATTDAAQQAGTFLAVQQKLIRQGITPAQYVDVRVDGRAYYK